MKKEDLRVTKTKLAIKEAFIELVELKGYSKVTVSAIVKKAHINRNTFYLHYLDKEDLISSITMETVNIIIEDTESNNYLANVKDIKELSEIKLRIWFRHLLKIVEPNVELFRIILLDHYCKGYILNAYNELKKHLANLLKVANPRSNLIFEYVINGMIGIIEQWIIYSPLSDPLTAKVLASLAYSDFLLFEKSNFNE